MDSVANKHDQRSVVAIRPQSTLSRRNTFGCQGDQKKHSPSKTWHLRRRLATADQPIARTLALFGHTRSQFYDCLQQAWHFAVFLLELRHCVTSRGHGPTCCIIINFRYRVYHALQRPVSVEGNLSSRVAFRILGGYNDGCGHSLPIYRDRKWFLGYGIFGANKFRGLSIQFYGFFSISYLVFSFQYS